MTVTRRDNRTMDLLSWEPPQVTVGYNQDVAGRGALDSKIARVLARALRDAKDDGKSRAEIAADMSRQLGRTISEDVINKWASEASGAHRIPLDAFIALIRATAAEELLGFIPEIFGFAVVPEKYAEIIEMHLLEEHEKDIAARKAALASRLGGRR